MYLKQKIDLKILISSGKFKLPLTFSTCSNLGVTLPTDHCYQGRTWIGLFVSVGIYISLQNVALQLDGHCFSVWQSYWLLQIFSCRHTLPCKWVEDLIIAIFSTLIWIQVYASSDFKGLSAAAAWSSGWRTHRWSCSSRRGTGWTRCRRSRSRRSAPNGGPWETQVDPAAAGPLAPRTQVPAEGTGQWGSAAVQPSPLPHHEECAQPHDSLPGWQVLPGWACWILLIAA